MRARKSNMICVGDLVLPIDEREFLFTCPDKIGAQEDPMEMIWEDTIGVVISVEVCDHDSEYCQVLIFVDEVTGWTYSDYIKVIHK